jgi:hypothetical protein
MLACFWGDADVTIATAEAALATGPARKSAPAHTFEDLVAAIEADAGPDLTESQRQLARRAATLSIQCQLLESRAKDGEEIDPVRYSTVANSLRRILRDLGGKRGERVAWWPRLYFKNAAYVRVIESGTWHPWSPPLQVTLSWWHGHAEVRRYKSVATRSSRGGSWWITLVQSRLGLTMTAYTTASAPPSLSRVAESTKFDARLVGITR